MAEGSSDKVGVPRPDPPDEDANNAGGRAPSVAALRGAPVDVDVRVVGRVALAVSLIALTVASALLFVAGAHRNAQLARLHDRGVPVEITVTGCLGLLGGSGSNPAGYTCRGAFVLDGHRYREVIPGSAFRVPGARISAVAVPDDPALLSTPGEPPARPSAGVYVVPSVLVVVAMSALAAIVVTLRRRRRSASASPDRCADGVSRRAD